MCSPCIAGLPSIDSAAWVVYFAFIVTALWMREARPRPRPSFGGGFPVPADSR